MAVTPTKTWEYSVNHVMSGADVEARNKEIFLRLKEALTDTGSPGFLDASGAALGSLTAPWTVVASSDAVTADATDRWDTVSKIVGAAAGVAHSWIHLRQVDYFGSGDHLNMLIACEDIANCSLGYVAFARGALGWNLDGTTTNRPTIEAGKVPLVTRDGLSSAGDPKSSDIVWGDDSTNDNRVLHVRISDDGKCGSWFICDSGACTAFAGWQEDEGGPSRNEPWMCWYLSDDSTAEQATRAFFEGHDYFRTLDDSNLEVNGYISSPKYGAGNASLLALNTGFDGSRFFFPPYLVYPTKTAIGGVLTDVWWGSDSDGTGDQAPTTPPVTFAKFSDIVIPWPSGTAQTIS